MISERLWLLVTLSAILFFILLSSSHGVVASSPLGYEDNEEGEMMNKRGWKDVSGSWGKRGWNDLEVCILIQNYIKNYIYSVYKNGLKLVTGD